MVFGPITIDGTFWLNILSMILIVISLCVAHRTLRQNERLLEASSRPYVAIKCEAADFGGQHFYLIIKNYGQTGAIVDNLDSNVDLQLCSYSKAYIPFKGIENCFLAPGQSLSCTLDYGNMKDNDLDEIEFTINYHSDTRSYRETCHLNIGVYSSLVYARPNIKEGDELKAIAQTLRGSAERML